LARPTNAFFPIERTVLRTSYARFGIRDRQLRALPLNYSASPERRVHAVRAAEVQAVVARMKGRANQQLCFFPCELKAEPTVHFRSTQLRAAFVPSAKVFAVSLPGVLIPF